MNVYIVLYESDYENEDVHTEVEVYANRDDAVRALNASIEQELDEGGYDAEERNELVHRDGDDYACVDYRYGKWMFRVTIYEREMK